MKIKLSPKEDKRSRCYRICLVVSGALVFCILGLIFLWQIEVGEDITVTDHLICQLVDMGQDAPLSRGIFEAMRGNRMLSLARGENFYVSNHDFERCWNMSPWAMRESGYVNRVTLQYRKQFLRGVSVARVLSVERTRGILKIRKGTLELEGTGIARPLAHFDK